MKVPMAYILGVSNGSMLMFDRRNRGVDAEISVGKVECKNAAGAIEKGKVQLCRD